MPLKDRVSTDALSPAISRTSSIGQEILPLMCSKTKEITHFEDSSPSGHQSDFSDKL